MTYNPLPSDFRWWNMNIRLLTSDPLHDMKLRSLRWRHSGRDGVSNHQLHGCLLNRLFKHRSKKTSKLCVTGLCAGNSPGTGEFPAQRASYAENVSIWWRHHVLRPADGAEHEGQQQGPSSQVSVRLQIDDLSPTARAHIHTIGARGKLAKIWDMVVNRSPVVL